LEDVDLTDDNLLTNEVEINVSMYLMGWWLVLDGLDGEVDDADVITIDKCALT
jgi:hypothetical protein